MKKLLITGLLASYAITSMSQHTSEDFKDAAGCGPFPFYIAAGYTTSKYGDLSTVGNEFVAKFSPGSPVKHNLRGVNAMFGATIIPAWWKVKLSLAAEGKYLYVFREIHAGKNTFAMFNNQLSLGAGIRYATFPFVIQAHYQCIIFSRQNYNFDLDGTRKAISVSSGGHVVFARLSLLDPAGSDGGWGFFFEYGRVFLNRDKNNELLTDVVKTFDETYTGTKNCTSGYGFFSLGFTVPLAIRIK